MNWKDTSSYSQSNKVREPVTFTLLVASLKIVVTRHIHHAPDAWVLTCQPWFEQREVGNGTADEAKAVALTLVRSKIAEAANAMSLIEVGREKLDAKTIDAEHRWRCLCSEQGWHVETQATLLGNFIRENGLFPNFLETAQAATEEA